MMLMAPWSEVFHMFLLPPSTVVTMRLTLQNSTQLVQQNIFWSQGSQMEVFCEVDTGQKEDVTSKGFVERTASTFSRLIALGPQ
jgi:hypothetical protein